MKCPNCSTSNATSAKFCSGCGGGLAGATGNLPPQYRLIGRYLIQRKIADGGFSAVYQAEDLRLRHTVAVKEMVVGSHGTNPHSLQQAVSDFQQEAELLAHITHPNLPRVIDRFEEGGRHFLVMDFVQGQTMREALQAASGQLPEATALAYAEQLCAVLGFLHTQSPPIIYRDLKPENILVQADGRLKLIDFGIARFYKPGQASDTTPLGTMGYAAPEQYGHGQSDVRTDVYALGATLYELVTGFDVSQQPFGLAPARQHNPNVSPRTEQALWQALELKPEDRFQHMEAFARALGGAGSSPVASIVVTPTASHTRSRRGWLWAGLVSAVMLGSWGGWRWTTAQNSPILNGIIGTGSTATPTDGPTATATDVINVALLNVSTPLATPTGEPTATKAPTVTPEPISTTVPSATPEPTNTSIPTNTPRPTNTPLPTPLPPTDTPRPTNTPLPTPPPTPVPLLTIAEPLSVLPLKPGLTILEQGIGQDGAFRQQRTIEVVAGNQVQIRFEREGTAAVTAVVPGLEAGALYIGAEGSAPWISRNGRRELVDNGSTALRIFTSDQSGTLRLSNRSTLPVPVDNVTLDLPVLITENEHGDVLWILDDPQNPYVLSYNDRNGFIRKVVAIQTVSKELYIDIPPIGEPTQLSSGRLAFAIGAGEHRWNVYTMEVAPGALPQLLEGTDDSEGAQDFNPVWSPDGSAIAFTSEKDKNRDIWVMDVDGRNARRLAGGAARQQYPAWSPDGTALAFAVQNNGPVKVFTMNLDRSNQRDLGFGGLTSWGRNGDLLLGYLGAGGLQDIWRWSSDGSNRDNLTNTAKITEDWVVWSPDGRRVVFVANPGTDLAKRQIWVMDADGGNRQQLTFGTAPSTNPAWSPDGQQIAFVSQQTSPDWQIWVMNADGTNQQQLTFDAGKKFYLSWTR